MLVSLVVVWMSANFIVNCNREVAELSRIQNYHEKYLRELKRLKFVLPERCGDNFEITEVLRKNIENLQVNKLLWMNESKKHVRCKTFVIAF